MKQELWARFHDSRYFISTLGNVRREDGRPIALTSTCKGYLKVSLTLATGRKSFTVHRMVLSTFGTPAPTPRHQTNHRNGHKADNRFENLEWVTGLENIRHAIDTLDAFSRTRATGARNGTRTHPERVSRGEGRWSHRLTERDVLAIRSRFTAGETKPSLAREFGVGASTIKKCVQRKTWQHLESKTHEVAPLNVT